MTRFSEGPPFSTERIDMADNALRYIDLRTIRQHGYVTVMPVRHYGPVPILVDGREIEANA